MNNYTNDNGTAMLVTMLANHVSELYLVMILAKESKTGIFFYGSVQG